MAITDEKYFHGHHPSVLRSHTWRTAENSAAYLLPSLRPGLRLLDIGCGPGTITADLAGLVSPGEVLGIDNGAAVIEQARERYGQVPNLRVGQIPNLRFEVGDVYALDLPDDSVDVVHGHQVLQHLVDPVAALRELRRVLVPGGLLAVRDSDYGAMTWYPADPDLDRWLDVYRRTARALHAEPDAGRMIHAWVAEAGFTEVRATASIWCFSSAEDVAWWGEMWAERAVASDFAARARDLGMATDEKLEQIGAAFRRWSESPDARFTVPHGEVLAIAP
jgi:ubiquinone/menaquinone biosynthesis C-methylase UbiE